MQPTLEVLFSPMEFATLRGRDLSQTTCVVFDILRATSTMLTALANGAESIRPVAEIAEAVAFHQEDATVLLAGEREGLRIGKERTGTIDFDLGNSPREFSQEKVQGRKIVMTTTNGTRALRACAGAKKILIGSFLNLRATANWLKQDCPPHLILVCSGTLEQAALEDTLAAGAVCERVWPSFAGGQADSAEIARRIYPLMQHDLYGAMKSSRNGRRLLAHRELCADVRFCTQRETLAFVAGLDPDGVIRKWPSQITSSSTDPLHKMAEEE